MDPAPPQQPPEAEGKPPDIESARPTNVVHYERRTEGGVQFSQATLSSDVIFIDDATPTPEIPQRQPYVPVNRRPRDDGEVLYIGPE